MGDLDKNESKSQGMAKGVIQRDHRVILAIHPNDADKIFSSQSSYGDNLTQDFRENVKALSQVYISIQRYLQGLYRSGDSYYPELEDVYKDLQIYKRSVSDKLPLPSYDELFCRCMQLAAQDPPFIHIIRDLRAGPKKEISFFSQFVAPTEKHDDKVIVAYRSSIDTSIKSLKTLVLEDSIALDYARLYSSIKSIGDIPYKEGRVDQAFKKMYILESELGNARDVDYRNLKIINKEIYKRSFRPLMMQAIKEKLVLSLSCESVRNENFENAQKVYDITLFLSSKELLGRYSALTRFLNPGMSNGLIKEDEYNELKSRLKSSKIDDFEFNHALAEIIYKKAIKQNDVNLNIVQIALEIQKLGEWLQKSGKQSDLNAEKDELQNTIKIIKDHGGLFRVRSSGKFNISEKFLKLMLMDKIGPILACTVPYENMTEHIGEIDISHYEHIYLIYKDRQITSKAIDDAIEMYHKNEDVYTLHVLENLFGLGLRSEKELKEYLAPAYLDKFRYVLRKSYVRYLPFFQKLWLTITSSEVSEKNLNRIRNEKRNQSIQTLSFKKDIANKGSTARKQVKKLVKEKQEDSRLSQKENDALNNLATYLDNKWSIGLFPSRHQIMSDAREESHEYNKLLGLIDAGAASVNKVVQIPNKIETVYAHLKYLQENKASLISTIENKLKINASTIVHQKRSLVLQKDTDQYKIEMHKAILNFLKLRV